jgi:hypothetical protein
LMNLLIMTIGLYLSLILGKHVGVTMNYVVSGKENQQI